MAYSLVFDWFMYSLAALYFVCQTHLFIISIAQFLLLLHSLWLRPSKLNQPLPQLPFVTIQLPVYNEKYMVQELIECVVKMNYPAHLLEIQLLDDSTDETTSIIESVIKNTKTDITINHIRRNDRMGFKAGALRNGLLHAKGEFIAIFDADFRPAPEFLTSTLPAFQDEKLGMVQTRCGYQNRSQTLITRTLAFGMDLYYCIEQGGRYQAGVFFLFNGTSGVWRRTCIEEAGNWSSDTLAEDMDLSYRAQLKGWKFKYMEQPQTNGELAPLVAAVRIQQYRWIKGGMECGLKLLPLVWKQPLSIYKKFHAYVQLSNSFAFLSIFICAVLSIPMMYIKDTYQITFAPASMFVFGSLVLLLQVFVSILKSKEYYLKSNFFYEAFFYMPLSLIIFGGLYTENARAALHGLLKRKTPFVRTPKVGNNVAKSAYVQKSRIRFVNLFELIFILYFMFGSSLAFYYNNYDFFTFHICLIIGYATIFYYSTTENR